MVEICARLLQLSHRLSTDFDASLEAKGDPWPAGCRRARKEGCEAAWFLCFAYKGVQHTRRRPGEGARTAFRNLPAVIRQTGIMLQSFHRLRLEGTTCGVVVTVNFDINRIASGQAPIRTGATGVIR